MDKDGFKYLCFLNIPFLLLCSCYCGSTVEVLHISTKPLLRPEQGNNINVHGCLLSFIKIALPLVFDCINPSVQWQRDLNHLLLYSCYLVSQLCLTLCTPMDCSTPGFPVLHYLLECAQIHVHWVDDAIQPSHLLSSPSPHVLNLCQHQGLFQWVGYPMGLLLCSTVFCYLLPQ